MHMADALLSPVVGLTMSAVSTGTLAYSVTKIKSNELCEKKIPIMAVAGAFVFAAQMINFTIPATGSSGHIGGGILLAALLGPFPALLTISSVLIIQALFFADGGLLALGCNIFNIGVIPCLFICPLIFRPMTKNGMAYKIITFASIVSVVVSLQLGAFGVVLQTLASGITEIPFALFTIMMQPIHLVIGLAEGIITASVLCFVLRTRPEIIETAGINEIGDNVSMKKIVIILAVITIAVGGVLSLFASSNPDGLEWSLEKAAGTSEISANGEIYEQAAKLQDNTAFMPDYDFAASSNDSAIPGTSVAGIVGSIITFIISGLVGLLISKAKKKARA